MRYLFICALSCALGCSDKPSGDPISDGGLLDGGDSADVGVVDSGGDDTSTRPDAQPGDVSTADTAPDSGPPPNVVMATSCMQPDVEAALALASNGDVVQVPAGTCDWSNMTIDQPVHLRGAGTDQTIITVSDITVSKHADGLTRVSGFAFSKSGGGNQSKGFIVGGGWRDTQPVVFQDNSFTIEGSGLFLLNCVGGVIIARNAFVGGWDDSFIQPKDSGDTSGSWTSADTMGMADTDGLLNHYVEDNTFDGGTNQGIDADDSTRVVYRHNTLTYSSFNTHGFATSTDGVRHFEVYENTFVHDGGESQLANQNWLIWLRGGTGVIFGNTFPDIAGSFWGDKSEIKLTIRGAEDARPQGDCANVSYPVPRQLGQSHDGQNTTTDPIYLWDNTGAQEIGAGWEWGNPCGLAFDDFFMMGRDLVDGMAKPGYTPYTYPHPGVLETP